MDNDTRVMPRMPEPATYEQEYLYWPWGDLLAMAAHWACAQAPKNGLVVDYMCGTGFLLDAISKLRPDLHLAGCDLAEDYVTYGRSKYPHLNIACCDSLAYRPEMRPQMTLCTAGLHHLPRAEQRVFLSKISAELEPGGHLVLGEEVIPDYETTGERKTGVLRAGFALLSFVISSGATDPVVAAAVDVLGNDLLERGEYKLSERMLLGMLEPTFEILAVRRIWPAEHVDYGDVLCLCRRR